MDLITPAFGLIFWQTLIFLVVLLILGKFAWKPILGALKSREESIDEALRSAELAKEEMTSLKADNEKLLAEAKQERDKMIKDAAKLTQEMKDQAKDVVMSSCTYLPFDAQYLLMVINMYSPEKP